MLVGRTATGDQRLPAAAALMVFASGSVTGHRSVIGTASFGSMSETVVEVARLVESPSRRVTL